jgi:hypothetical protein
MNFYLLNLLVLFTVGFLRAADQELPYESLKTLQSEYASDLVTFIKRLSNGWLVVCDRKGRGEIFDTNDEYKSVYNFSYTPYHKDYVCLGDIFYFEDENKEKLLVGSDDSDELYVINLRKPCSESGYIYVGHPYQLRQRIDDTLIFVNDNNATVGVISLSWQDVEQQKKMRIYEGRKDAPVLKSNQQEVHAKILVRNEGLVTNYQSLEIDKVAPLVAKKFNIDSILHTKPKLITNFQDFAHEVVVKTIFGSPSVVMTQIATGTDGQEHRRRSLDRMTCYHESTDKILFLGHDNGRVSVWH